MPRKLKRFYCSALLLAYCCIAPLVSAQVDLSPCSAERQGTAGATSQVVVKRQDWYEPVASDVTLHLTLVDGKTIYREGEIIPLNLAFTSASKEKYTASTRTYDRSGRLNMETFCVTPGIGRDPLDDYYGSGIWTAFVAGGLSGGDQVLSLEPFVVREELNEWKALPPGSYTLRVASDRVGATRPKSAGAETKPVLVVSNDVPFEIIAATPEWQAEQLALALSVLDGSPPTTESMMAIEQPETAARVLRFLGSEASTRELARRFWSPAWEQHGWDFEAGLIASPHRPLAIQELDSAIDDPRHPVTSNLIETLALLEIQSMSEYKLAPYDPNRTAEWEKQRKAKVAAYETIVAKLTKRTAAALNKKLGAARAVTADTLADKRPDIKEVPLWDLTAWWHEMSLTSQIVLSSLIALFFLSGMLIFQRLKQRPSDH